MKRKILHKVFPIRGGTDFDSPSPFCHCMCRHLENCIQNSKLSYLKDLPVHVLIPSSRVKAHAWTWPEHLVPESAMLGKSYEEMFRRKGADCFVMKELLLKACLHDPMPDWPGWQGCSSSTMPTPTLGRPTVRTCPTWPWCGRMSSSCVPLLTASG